MCGFSFVIQIHRLRFMFCAKRYHVIPVICKLKQCTPPRALNIEGFCRIGIINSYAYNALSNFTERINGSRMEYQMPMYVNYTREL